MVASGASGRPGCGASGVEPGVRAMLRERWSRLRLGWAAAIGVGWLWSPGSAPVSATGSRAGPARNPERGSFICLQTPQTHLRVGGRRAAVGCRLPNRTAFPLAARPSPFHRHQVASLRFCQGCSVASSPASPNADPHRLPDPTLGPGSWAAWFKRGVDDPGGKLGVMSGTVQSEWGPGKTHALRA